MELKIFKYIEIWYIKKRRHITLNYQTIEEFNKQNLPKCSLADTGNFICISNFFLYIIIPLSSTE